MSSGFPNSAPLQGLAMRGLRMATHQQYVQDDYIFVENPVSMHGGHTRLVHIRAHSDSELLHPHASGKGLKIHHVGRARTCREG